MKKIVIIVMICCIAMIFAGCVHVNYVVEVDEDESTQVTLIAEIDKVMSIDEVEEYIEQHFQHHLEYSPFQNYPYEIYETEEHIVFEVQGLSERSTLNINHFAEFNISSTPSLRGRHFPFYRSKEMTSPISIPESSIKGYVNQSYLQDDVEIKLNLTLPFTITEHNADMVSHDGKTLIWEIDPYNTNNIQFTYVNNELYKPILFVVILGTIIFIGKRRSVLRSTFRWRSR